MSQKYLFTSCHFQWRVTFPLVSHSECTSKGRAWHYRGRTENDKTLTTSRCFVLVWIWRKMEWKWSWRVCLFVGLFEECSGGKKTVRLSDESGARNRGGWCSHFPQRWQLRRNSGVSERVRRRDSEFFQLWERGDWWRLQWTCSCRQQMWWRSVGQVWCSG